MNDGRRVPVNLEVQRTTLPLPSGKKDEGDLVMLYEPQSQLFWWQYRRMKPGYAATDVDNPLADSLVYVTGGKIVVFNFYSPFVWVRESTERYASLAEGRAGVEAALKKMSGKIEAGEVEWFQGVNVAKALGTDFLRLKDSASPFPQAKLREVSRVGDRWRLLLDGPNKDSAELFLSDDYQIVEAKRLPANQ